MFAPNSTTTLMRIRLASLLLVLPLLIATGCAEKNPAPARRDSANPTTGAVREKVPTPTERSAQAKMMAERYLRTHEHQTGTLEMEGEMRDDGVWTVVTMKGEGGRWQVWVNPLTNETRDAVLLAPAQ